MRLEARQVVVDIANSVERMKLEEESARKNEKEEEARLVAMMVDLENEEDRKNEDRGTSEGTREEKKKLKGYQR